MQLFLDILLLWTCIILAIIYVPQGVGLLVLAVTGWTTPSAYAMGLITLLILGCIKIALD